MKPVEAKLALSFHALSFSSIPLMVNQHLEWVEYRWVYFIIIVSSEITSICFQMMLALVCDQINTEEENLKVILAKHLCSFSLDKEAHTLVRTFMAVVKTKSLSFNLLRVANVGVHLFIQCLSLPVKYVIILLQFGKLAERALLLAKN
ncbi:hypothetical protein EVAR_42373_1 [Eumeta japonica]|uniref:Uncharacterized protein n=1 Tax=Eumeta variegata TaxID=151549 RepID=A0A4C1YJA3_EUMVA|nr:hypothetical protein EVAR_42373_1 [Eumeta japonica]